MAFPQQIFRGKCRYSTNIRLIYMNKNFRLAILFLSIIMMGGYGCRHSAPDWSSPVRIYDTLCSCKNSSGHTVDAGLKKMLDEKNIQAENADQINTWISANATAFVAFVDSDFKNDPVFMSELNAARDTLEAHGARLETEGAFTELFSIKVKYPGCVLAMPYLITK